MVLQITLWNPDATGAIKHPVGAIKHYTLRNPDATGAIKHPNMGWCYQAPQQISKRRVLIILMHKC